MPLFHHKIKATDLGFLVNGFRVLETLFESVWIRGGLYKYQTCLIFFTTVTDPLSPLPTNTPEASPDPNSHNPMLPEASCYPKAQNS